MAETTQIFFSHKEVVTALLKTQGIHSGVWALAVQFGLGAGNAGATADGSDANPAAIVPILKLGLQKVDTVTGISVDAAEVNPS